METILIVNAGSSSLKFHVSAAPCAAFTAGIGENSATMRAQKPSGR